VGAERLMRGDLDIVGRRLWDVLFRMWMVW